MNVLTELREFLSDLLRLAEGAGGDNSGSVALATAAYIFMGLGLYAMAQKRCISRPWLAWIPIGNLWLLSCLSDQYFYLTRGKDQSRRRSILIYSLVAVGSAVLIAILGTVLYLSGVFATLHPGDIFSFDSSASVAVLFLLLLAVESAGFMVAVKVIYCISLYHIFCSCDPSKKKLYATAGIIASCLGIDLVGAILLYICREKEAGMPPRIR